jgi:hypothetical protein
MSSIIKTGRFAGTSLMYIARVYPIRAATCLAYLMESRWRGRSATSSRTGPGFRAGTFVGQNIEIVRGQFVDQSAVCSGAQAAAGYSVGLAAFSGVNTKPRDQQMRADPAAGRSPRRGAAEWCHILEGRALADASPSCSDENFAHPPSSSGCEWPDQLTHLRLPIQDWNFSNNCLFLLLLRASLTAPGFS